MRGKPCHPAGRPDETRNIPAYAGKTSCCFGLVLKPTEHPRVCGENVPRKSFFAFDTGTSPRMRGKPPAEVAADPRSRNIPAYAGKTSSQSSSSMCQTEHPRVCGENNYDAPAGSRDAGTSPRMRGKHRVGKRYMESAGNIPAYAGKTDTERTPSCLSKEHPRVCGENPQRLARDDYQRGTSPRMRGKPRLCTIADFRVGNIPAYAGKTRFRRCVSGRNPEHPRVCGENPATRRAGRTKPGTSPRMRGKRWGTSGLIRD